MNRLALDNGVARHRFWLISRIVIPSAVDLREVKNAFYYGCHLPDR